MNAHLQIAYLPAPAPDARARAPPSPKVVHDAGWRLPQWGGKPDMPRQLRDALCASLPAAERAAADARFASHVTFLDPTFRRVSGGIGHLNSTCLGVVAAS